MLGAQHKCVVYTSCKCLVRFRMCPHTMRLLPYMLAKLNAMPSAQKWLGLRVSYGMNGILLRSEDLKSFATYMRYAQ